MINYLQKIIDDFPEVIRSTYAMYVVEHLFTVKYEKDSKLFPEEQA